MVDCARRVPSLCTAPAYHEGPGGNPLLAEARVSRDRGDWIPWYCETTAGWAELSLAARGVAEGTARLMGPKRSEVHLGSRGLRGLCVLLHAKWEEFEPAMVELLGGAHPRLVLSEDHRVLIDPDHESRRRPTSTERVHRFRKKAESAPDSETHETVSPVSQPPETGVTVSSPLLSSDLISSSKGEPERGPPDWFAATAQRVMDDTGEKFGIPEAWIRYSGHRGNKGIAKNDRDASYWLGTVMVPEARKEAKDAARQRERDARFKDHTPKYEQPTPKQTKDFHAELVRKLAEENAKKGAA